MLLAHVSDIHIGANRRIPDYISHYKLMLDEIVEVISSRKVKMVIISGDIYDQKNTTPEEQYLATKWVIDLDSLGIPIILMSGNHDELSPSKTSLGSFKLLEAHGKLTNISVVESDSVLKFKSLDTDVLCIPDCGVEGFWKKVKSFIKKSKRTNKILVSHGMFKGSHDTKAAGVVTFTRGTEGKYIKGLTYGAMGDIHTSQRVAKNIFYSGSPVQHNFGESLPKGILIVDTEDANNPELVGLKKPKKFHVLTKVPKDGKWPKGFISLRVSRDKMPAILPSKVIHSCPVGDGKKIKNSIRKSVGDLDILEYLDSFLSAKEVSNKDHTVCYRLLENIDPGLSGSNKRG